MSKDVWDPLINEINDISNPQIRSFVKFVLSAAPAYFWTIPASTSGKYHPHTARQPCGLVHHTRAVVYFVKGLMLAMECEQWRDELIAAAIIHDVYKNGDGNTKYGVNWPAHGQNLRSMLERRPEWRDIYLPEFRSTIDKILDISARHMSKWGGTAPRPTSMEDYCLSLSDYVASRKLVNITNFDESAAP